MSVDQSLPTTAPYGKATWTDYEDNWRNKDANWLQTRSILRYANPAARDADITSPEVGQFVFSADVDILTYRSGTGVWKYYKPLPQFTTTTQDDAAGVALSHLNAGGKGVILGPGSPAGTGLVTLNAPLTVMGGVLTVGDTTAGVTIKTGTKTVKLTTSATDLVSDSPLTVPSITLGGTGTVISAAGKVVSVGTINADTGTITNVNVSGIVQGGTYKGAVDATTVNASTGGTIGGVAISGNTVVAPGGFIGQGAFLRGDAGSGILSYRNPSGGAVATSAVTVDATYLRFRAPNGIPLDKGDGAHTGAWVGGAVVSASDPGAGNFPNGTIWVS
jgi:hypothetical protein